MVSNFSEDFVPNAPTLWSLIDGGGWNSRGGWKKSQKLIAGGVGIIGGGWKKSQ